MPSSCPVGPCDQWVDPPYVTLPLAHPRRRAAERAFGLGSFVRIDWRPEGPIGACRRTVGQAIAARGGQVACGWQIHLWPGLYVEALFHCVWEHPSGLLIDLSAKYPADPAYYTVFVQDRSATLAMDPPSKYHLLRDAPEIHVLLDAMRAQIDSRRAVEARVLARRRLDLCGEIAGGATRQEQVELSAHDHWVGVAIGACVRLAERRVHRRVDRTSRL